MISTLIDKKFMDDLSAQAKASKRLRSHHCLHQSHQDKVQRVCIAVEPGTYIRPHAHLENDKWEYLSILRGAVDFLLFSPAGQLQQRIHLQAGAETTALEISPGTWHTLLVQQSNSILFEVKAGPFNADSIANFADWAPNEGAATVDAFIQRLSDLDIGAMASQT